MQEIRNRIILGLCRRRREIAMIMVMTSVREETHQRDEEVKSTCSQSCDMTESSWIYSDPKLIKESI